MKFQQLIKFIRECDYKMPLVISILFFSAMVAFLTMAAIDLFRGLGGS